MIEYPCSRPWVLHPERCTQRDAKPMAEGNPEGGGDGFLDTSFVLVEHGNNASNFRLNIHRGLQPWKGLREGEQTGVIAFGIEPSSSCQPAFLSPLHSPLPLPRDLYQSKFKIQKWWWLAFVSRPDQTLGSVRLKILKDP